MKNKFDLRKLIFIFIGMFFCVIPIEAKAADYEASFKFYTADDSVILDMINDFNMWGMKYSFGMGGTLTEITDLTQLKKDQYLLVAPSLKTIGNVSASGLAFYFTYKEDYLESPVVKSGNLKAGIANKTGDTMYPNSTFTINSADNEDGNVSITIAPSASAMQPVDATNITPACFYLFKLKKDVDSSDPLTFKWWTPDNPLVDSKGTFSSSGSTPNSDPVYFEFVDYEPETPASGVKTLASINAINGSNKYIDLNWASGSNDTTFNGTIPANINNLTLTIKPFHAAASIEVCPDAACKTTAFSLLANSGIALLSGDADNTLTTTLSNLTTGSNKSYYKVTAENGDEEIYTIDIKKLNDDASLGSVTLTNGITLNYDSATKTYSASNVPFSTNKTNISASVTTNSNAVIDSTGTTWNVISGAINNIEWNLTNTGTTANTGTIKVNAENCDSAYNSVPGNTCTTNT